MDITSETASLTIGVSSFVISIIFFFAARRSEIESIKVLAAIKEQVNTLNNINDNLLSTAIHHLASTNKQLIDTASLQLLGKARPDQLIKDTLDSTEQLVAILFYTTRGSYFAQLFKSQAPLNDETKETHVLADDIIKSCKTDYNQAIKNINSIEEGVLTNHRLYSVYQETRDRWEAIVNV